MNRVNVYKRFCAVFMILVMIFCGGRCVYANDYKLQEAEDAAVKANLIALNDKTPEKYDNEAKCWDKVAELFEAAGDIEASTSAKIAAATARARRSKRITLNDKTSDNWGNVASCWDAVADLCEGSERCKPVAKADWARVQQAEMIALNDQTPENYENLAICWENAAYSKEQTGYPYDTWDDITEQFPDDITSSYEEIAAIYRANAANARAKAAEISAEQAKNDPTSENFENVATCWIEAAECWDEAIECCEEAADWKRDEEAAKAKANAAKAKANAAKAKANAANARAQAAWLMAQHAEMLAHNDKIPESWINVVNCWEKVATYALKAEDKHLAKIAKQKAENTREHINDNSSKKSLDSHK